MNLDPFAKEVWQRFMSMRSEYALLFSACMYEFELVFICPNHVCVVQVQVHVRIRTGFHLSKSYVRGGGRCSE